MKTPNRIDTQIPDELAGERVDKALAAMFPEFSRSMLKEWLLSGRILVESSHVRPRERVSGGEQVELWPPDPAPSAATAEAIPLDILYTDEHLLVLDKPAGLVTHPGAGNPSGTLLNGLLHFDPGLADLPRAGLVHRLDKDTSGLMVVARTQRTYLSLVEMLATHDVRRCYEAAVVGVPISGGSIEEPIGRHPSQRTRMAVTPGGRPAVSHYRVAHKYRAHAHLEVELETGRTHQIRVHLAHIGYAIIGDPTYGARQKLPPRPSAELVSALRAMQRQALHARELAFRHPVSGEDMRFETPRPGDFNDLLAALAVDASAAND